MGEFFDNMYGKHADQNHLPPLELPEAVKNALGAVTENELGDLSLEWTTDKNGDLVAHANCGASIRLDRSRVVAHRYPKLLKDYMMEEVIDGLGKMIRHTERLRERLILQKKGPMERYGQG